MERGRQLLLKDGLLDEEVNRKHQDDTDSAKDKLEKLGNWVKMCSFIIIKMKTFIKCD